MTERELLILFVGLWVGVMAGATVMALVQVYREERE